jgi:hypothetical protein
LLELAQGKNAQNRQAQANHGEVKLPPMSRMQGGHEALHPQPPAAERKSGAQVRGSRAHGAPRAPNNYADLLPM